MRPDCAIVGIYRDIYWKICKVGCSYQTFPTTFIVVGLDVADLCAEICAHEDNFLAAVLVFGEVLSFADLGEGLFRTAVELEFEDVDPFCRDDHGISRGFLSIASPLKSSFLPSKTKHVKYAKLFLASLLAQRASSQPNEN